MTVLTGVNLLERGYQGLRKCVYNVRRMDVPAGYASVLFNSVVFEAPVRLISGYAHR